jgi:arsenate reductase
VLAALDGDLRRLCNTSGRDYRELGLSVRLPTLSPAEALALLAGNGNLIKRPVLLGPGVALAGFQPEVWRAALSR